MELLPLLLSQTDLFILVLVRISALFIIVPFFSQQTIPTYTKVGLTVFLTFTMMAAIPNTAIQYEPNLVGYLVVVVQEFVVGILIGFSMYLIFTVFLIAGQIVDAQIGFGMANVMDPFSQIQVPITGNFYFFIATMLFVLANGHHKIIEVLYKSFMIIPIGRLQLNQNLFDFMVLLITRAFQTGVRLAIPILITMLLLDIALGLLTKVAPQINIFVVGFIIKIIVGLLAVYLMLPAFITVSDNIFAMMFDYAQKLLEVLK